MATVVLQSFRPDPPAWIARCLASTRHWAAEAGFAYRFVGDELFERLPAWARAKTAARVPVASDLARLALIEEMLAADWSAAIWLDADVLVFDPAALSAALDLSAGYLLGREAWVQPGRRGGLQAPRGVHNAVCAFRRDNPFLAFYRHAAARIVARHDGAMVPQLVGPKLLTALDNMMGLPASWAVNMASPHVLRDIAGGGGPALDLLAARSGAMPAALNLSHSHAGARHNGVTVDEPLLTAVIDRLLADGATLFPQAGRQASPRRRPARPSP